MTTKPLTPHVEESLQAEELLNLADALEAIEQTAFGTLPPQLQPGQSRIYARAVLSYIVGLEIRLQELEEKPLQGSPLAIFQGRPYQNNRVAL